MQSLWPYHSFRPVTWDRYYVNDYHEKPTSSSVSGGVAAGLTIGIFFMVFIFTFGCRIYSQYVDRTQQQNNNNAENMLSESIAEDMWICGIPRNPPPPYEVAIKMPISPPPSLINNSSSSSSSTSTSPLSMTPISNSPPPVFSALPPPSISLSSSPPPSSSSSSPSTYSSADRLTVEI
ncbi:unnamed protein product [Auanema sp. JU1783]|nr:unnamed protein product [Auanema sp. JU1783]